MSYYDNRNALPESWLVSDKPRYCLDCQTMMPPNTPYHFQRQCHAPACPRPLSEIKGAPSREEFDRMVAGYQSTPPKAGVPRKPRILRAEPGEPDFIGPRTLGTKFRWPQIKREELVPPGTFGRGVFEDLEESIKELLIAHKDEGVVKLPYQTQCVECMNPVYAGTLVILGYKINPQTERALVRHFNWLDKNNIHHGCSFRSSELPVSPGRITHSRKRPGADGEDIVDEPMVETPLRRRGSSGYMHSWGRFSEAGPPPARPLERKQQ